MLFIKVLEFWTFWYDKRKINLQQKLYPRAPKMKRLIFTDLF